MSSTTQYDVVIVGGGSAGAVLANRLSADAGLSVLLLEAGPAFRPAEYPDVLASADRVAASADYDWGYFAEPGRIGHRIHTVRGKVLGGSSAVNAAVAIRARPSDFARWTAHGVESWSFAEVLPTYRRLEASEHEDARWHCRDGPLPIHQRTRDELTPSLRAFIGGAQALGFPAIEDFNGALQYGVGAYPLNVVGGVRMNTGLAYLGDDVRARPNLTIRGGAEVDRLLLRERRAVGVRLVGGEEVPAGEVILAAGVYGSPAILLRSGIGPADDLRALGIVTIADLPVGRRLMDHPFFYNVYALRRGVHAMTPASGAILWTRSASAAPDELDLQVSATHLFDRAASPTGGAIVLAVAVTLPDSIGTVRLASADPRRAPLIDLNFLAEDRDRRRLFEGVRLARRIGETTPFAECVDRELQPGRDVRSEAELEAAVLATLDTYQHATSTVPMGGDDDRDAVVDPRGAVRGFDRLRVVDASIFPEIPSVPTNLTTIMLAERIAESCYA